MIQNWKKLAVMAGIALAAVAGIVLLVIFVAVPAAKYGKAGALERRGDRAAACDAFDRLGGYRNAQARKQKLQDEVIATRSVQRMAFGGHSWLVLEERDGRALLLLEVIEEKQPFDEPGSQASWEACTLRGWLNGAFYRSFGQAERARIAETAVVNSGNAEYRIKGGGVTRDHIFLLSLEEAKLYFPDDAARVGRSRDGRAAWWWLRSPGMAARLAAVVAGDGTLGAVGNDVDYYDRGVRPAMWVTMQ